MKQKTQRLTGDVGSTYCCTLFSAFINCSVLVKAESNFILSVYNLD